MTETDAQTRRDIARAMLRMFEEVEGAAVDRMLSALRFAESNLPAESHPSAIREAVEQEREAIAEIADEDAMNIRSQIRKVSESDVVNSIDAAAKWNRATALEDFAFCVRARTKDEANG